MSVSEILRSRRQELGMTQDQVAAKAGISKPYLSNIETGKARPPTDGVLRMLEGALRFQPGELMKVAHLARTPMDVRQEHEMLSAEVGRLRTVLRGLVGGTRKRKVDGIDIRDLLAEGDAPGHAVAAGPAVPIINKTAAGYPHQFTDLDYPVGVADEYIRCPDLHDPQSFGIRVVGDSMEPRYREGDIVVFSPALEVRNGAGELLDTVNIGSGYAPGDPINIGNGLYVSMPVGTVTDTESFSILALAETDTSGLLAAAGMNTLFSGNSATTLGVRQELQDDPARLAVASSGDMTDNINVHRMADLSETTLTALGDLTPSDAYREMVTGVGQSVAVRESRLEGMEAVMRQLEQRRDEIGGVDVNEEAAKLLVYEQMFQGVAKFMNTQKDALDMLAQLL